MDDFRSVRYFVLLILGKLLRCIGIFFIDILAKQVHVVSLLWSLKFITSAILIPIQKPFLHGKPLRKSLHIRIIQLSLFNCFIEIIWLYGITFCGPLRSILVFEQSPAIVLVALMTIIKGGNGPSKTRGTLALFAAFLALILMDSDATVEADHNKSHSHQSILNHLFYHAITWSGVSDHKGGVVLLAFALVIKVWYDSSFRHLAVEIGGPKRLYSLINVSSAFILTPFAILFFIFGKHVADPVMASARWSPIIMFISSFLLAWMWYTPDHHEVGTHALSSGVVLTLFFSMIASFALTSSSAPRSRGGHYVGLSDNGLPLYTYGEAFLQKTSRWRFMVPWQSMLLFLKETLSEIFASSDSRRIFWFLCANLLFCVIEFLYGFWTNSLGLISDGFHMLFDCSALVMGLVASVMARWAATRYYSYGYGRVEVLSGFINALFLIVIALFVFLEALERLYDPPDVSTDKLMIVAVAGLVINLFGMYAFHGGTHGHSHGSASSASSRAYDYDGSNHGHSHAKVSHGHSHGGNANMQGVFLHVLADTLGSVFVIISTLLMQYFNWKWVDPLCSLVLSILILSSVYPLLIASTRTLMQDVPQEIEDNLNDALNEVLEVEGVISYSKPHFWQLKSEVNIGTLHVQVADDVNAQAVRQTIIRLLKEAGAIQMVVQVEKQSFIHRIQSICPSYKLGHPVTKGFNVIGNGHLNKSEHNHGHSHSHESGKSRHAHLPHQALYMPLDGQ
uniref:Proton-coupled zinc antiporter SLC30A5 n=1 Tax=Syphacia muris TaxID=451379 RepID=A0A0N5AY42_9BILA